MDRYKIIKMDTHISKKEVDTYKDFDAMLRSYKKSQLNKRMLLIVIPISILVGTSLFIYFSFYSQRPASYIEPTPNEHHQMAKSIMDSTVIPINEDTLELKTREVIKVEKERPPSKNNNVTKESNLIAEQQEDSFVKAHPEYELDSLFDYFNHHLNNKSFSATKGKLIVAFTIDSSGAPGSVQIIQTFSEEIDSEIIKLVKEMPNWSPALMNGKPVSSTCTLPIEINIQSVN